MQRAIGERIPLIRMDEINDALMRMVRSDVRHRVGRELTFFEESRRTYCQIRLAAYSYVLHIQRAEKANPPKGGGAKPPV